MLGGGGLPGGGAGGLLGGLAKGAVSAAGSAISKGLSQLNDAKRQALRAGRFEQFIKDVDPQAVERVQKLTADVRGAVDGLGGNSNTQLAAIGNVVAQVEALPNEEQRQQQWQRIKPQLEKSLPGVVMPNNFSPEIAAAAKGGFETQGAGSAQDKRIQLDQETGVGEVKNQKNFKTRTTPSNKLQNNIINSRIQRESLQDLTKLYKPEFLTVPGQFRASALKAADKFGLLEDDSTIGNIAEAFGLDRDSSRKFLSNRRQFVEGVEGVFNNYRKLITGAQASVKELELLRQSVLNKDVGPAEFEGSINRLNQELLRVERVSSELLDRGLSPEDKGYGKELDRRLKEERVEGDIAIKSDLNRQLEDAIKVRPGQEKELRKMFADEIKRLGISR